MVLTSTNYPLIPAMAYTARGVVIGRIDNIRPHPNGQAVLLADVAYSHNKGTLQVVFGGKTKVVKKGCLVPFARPTKACRVAGVKMRRRKFRGEYSYGELCSLFELGLSTSDTDQVAILRDDTHLQLGSSLDEVILRMSTLKDMWRVFKKPLF